MVKHFKLRFEKKMSFKTLSIGSYFSLEVKDSPSFQVINKHRDGSFDVRRVVNGLIDYNQEVNSLVWIFEEIKK